MAEIIQQPELSPPEQQSTHDSEAILSSLPSPGQLEEGSVQRAQRVQLSEEEVVKRMEEFPLRKEKFIAAIREGKNRSVYPLEAGV